MRDLHGKKNKPKYTQVCKDRCKPEVFLYTSKSGKRRIIGTNTAARWIGMRQQDFSRIVSRILNPSPREVAYERKKALIKESFPELFS